MGAKQTKNTSSTTFSLKYNGNLKRNKTFSNEDNLKEQQQQLKDKRKSTTSLSAYYNNNNNEENHNNLILSSSCTTSATTSSSVSNNKLNNVHFNKNQQKQEDINNKNNKSAFKRFGISPRFKRKIVEVITKTANNTNNTANNAQIIQKSNNTIFANSKLLNVFQSQLNLFQSVRLINKYTKNQTMLSISVQRNSLRYASRRKFHTQSLANPFRHANTNYPVFIHEALFLPEFSVKGKVTEADFEICDVISRGAFGHVIKVKRKHACFNYNVDKEVELFDNDNKDEIYAMKIMWKSQIIRDRALQQVKDEVTIAFSCSDNPFIVKTWWYWQSKRFLYIITSFIENGELLSLWLKLHHLPQRLIALYTIEMSLILDYLHNKGIIYRDIKMENILLDPNGHIKLIDFGLSKWLNLGDRTTTICGTIQYMSPEILGVEPYTHAVDWWSLGILIYALFTGEYPLNAAKDHIQMCDKVQKHTFELDSSKYSQQACSIIRKLLRKNPYQRLKSLNEIKNDEFLMDEYKNYLKETNQISDSRYWNANTVFNYYTPFKILAYELEKGRKKNFNNENSDDNFVVNDYDEYEEDDDEDLEMIDYDSHMKYDDYGRKNPINDNFNDDVKNLQLF